ncbi:DUF6234 family protein [Nocardioides humi]|uniref:DUF6234 domain-containing protein n=1 Tax=Nocardioides humi TaxID=449461 RepID=A0ABN2A1A9_9ACTN|nr:DUF6234 family protein [Nocardioides humi]
MPVTERDHPALLRPLVEALASATAVGTALFLPLLYLGSHLCAFGECSVPGPEEIRTYRVLVTVLAAAAVTTLVLAVRRRARGAVVWHAVVALAGLVSAVAFAMPAIDGDALRHDDLPQPNPDYVPCYSGSGDCVGG